MLIFFEKKEKLCVVCTESKNYIADPARFTVNQIIYKSSGQKTREIIFKKRKNCVLCVRSLKNTSPTLQNSH